MTRFLLVKYAEVHLKGQNRPYFQRLLLRNIRQAVAPHGGEAVFHDSRIFVTDYSDENACIDSIRKVFGVHAVSPAIQMGKEDFNAIAQQAADMMGDEQGSFKVVARRADKRFFLESPEI